jgi:hypothetical protein
LYAAVVNAGVHLTYEGEGVTVETSIDGTTWTTRNNRITIYEGTDLVGKLLFIRLTLADEDSWVSRLTIDVFRSRTMAPYRGFRNVSFSAVDFDYTPNHQLDYAYDMGATIKSGGYIDIQPDASELPTSTRLIEFWLKKNSTGNFVVVEEGTSLTKLRINASNQISWDAGFSSVRVNNASATSGTTTVNVGEWNFYQIVMNANRNQIIRIGAKQDGTESSDINVYGLALYSADQTNSYALNIGQPALVVDETDEIDVTEYSPVVEIYAYTWTTSA